MRPFTIPSKAWTGFKGYVSDPYNCPPDHLSYPSVNSVITDVDVAQTRMGFELKWNVTSSEGIRGFHVQRYNITFFTAGTALKYIDHNRSDAVVTVTGVTLTSGTVTRFAEYASDVYLTNQTDGVYRIVVSAIATANTLGNNLVCDSDIGPRLSSFSLGTGDVLVNGTTEAYTGVTTSTTTTLTCTSTAGYSVGAIVLRVDQRASLPKGSMITFWKERMVIAGVKIANSSTDQPTATLHFSKFATAGALENIVDFTYGAGGSTMELVGKSGTITAIQATEDYLYVFKENETYVISVADVDPSNGQSIPNLRSSIYGCVNPDCVADTGNGEVVFVTPQRRFMRIKIATDSGAAVVFPDESFDVAIRSLVRYLDPEQTLANVFYHKGKRRAYFTAKFDGQWLRMVSDNSIRGWQPPQTGINMNQYIEINGIAYGLSRSNGKVYQMESTNNDNGAQIQSYICTGVFDVGHAYIDELHVKGTITQNTTIRVKAIVNGGETAGKEIVGSAFSYDSGNPLGSFTMGDSTIGGEGIEDDTAEYDKLFDVYPSEANKVQLCMHCMDDSGYFSLREYQFQGTSHNVLAPSLS